MLYPPGDKSCLCDISPLNKAANTNICQKERGGHLRGTGLYANKKMAARNTE